MFGFLGSDYNDFWCVQNTLDASDKERQSKQNLGGWIEGGKNKMGYHKYYEMVCDNLSCCKVVHYCSLAGAKKDGWLILSVRGFRKIKLVYCSNECLEFCLVKEEK